MNQNEQEIEVKFLLFDLLALEQKLKSMGARLVSPRTFESNLRFDHPDGSLSKTGQVLRLRHDQTNVITYKGPGSSEQGVLSRQEIEFRASSFNAARHLFEALGFRVAVAYEKRRTTYAWQEVEIMLDEMPYGNFCEIEGTSPAQIEAAAGLLALDWQARILASYMMLFQQVKEKRHLVFRDLVFFNFKGITISADDLGVKYADLK
jgi:adenylate cyclase class 2